MTILTATQIMQSDNYRFSFTYRKYLGTDCKTSKENAQLKQQLRINENV